MKFIVFYPIYCCVILYYNVLAAFVFVTETRAISLTKDKTFLDFSYRQCSRKKMKFGWAGLSSIKLVSLMHRLCYIQSVEINIEYWNFCRILNLCFLFFGQKLNPRLQSIFKSFWKSPTIPIVYLTICIFWMKIEPKTTEHLLIFFKEPNYPNILPSNLGLLADANLGGEEEKGKVTPQLSRVNVSNYLHFFDQNWTQD